MQLKVAIGVNHAYLRGVLGSFQPADFSRGLALSPRESGQRPTTLYLRPSTVVDGLQKEDARAPPHARNMQG